MRDFGFPAVRVEAAFADGPGTLPGDATWTDLTDHTLSWDVRRGRGSQFDQPQPSSATVRFRNDDGALSPQATFGSMVRADNPVGWWQFDETSGDFADSSGNGYTLTASTGGTIDYDEQGTVGAAFDTLTTGRATRSFTAALNPAQITIEMWFKPASMVVAHYLWECGATGTGYVCSFNADGSVYAGAVSGSPSYVSAPAGTVAVGRWTHIVWTNDGSTGNLYIDGVLVSTGAQPYAVNVSTAILIVGDEQTDTYNFRGLIDDFAIYNGVLSPGRILAHASGISVPVGAQVRISASHYRARVHADSPVGYWLLDETSGTSAVDDSGNGRNGTHTGPTVNQTSLLALESGSDGQQPYVRRSVRYDGSNDYTEVAYNADWSPADDSFTVHFLAQFAAVGAGTARNLVAKSDSSSTDWSVRVNTSNELEFEWTDAGGVSGVRAFVAFTPVVGQTYHVAGTWDGSINRLYVDGVEVYATGDFSVYTPRDGSGRPLWFARRQNSYGFNGYLDEIAIHQTCLPAETISDLAEMALDGTCVFHGYADEWPNSWEGQQVGMSTVTAFDALAELAQTELPLADWGDWTLSERPDMYLRLADPEGTAVAKDETGRYPAPVSHDPFGLSDSGIVWEFEPSAVDDGTGAIFVSAILEPPRAALTSGTGEFTVECWMSVQSGTTSTRYILVGEDSNATNVDVVVAVTTTVDAESMTVTGVTDGDLTVTGNRVQWVGAPTLAGTDQWVHIVFSRHVAGGTETLMLWVNGTTLLSDWPDYTVESLDSTRLFIGGDADLVGNNLSGDILDELAVYPRAITPPTVGEQRTGQTLRWPLHRTDWGLGRWRGDLPSDRIQRILDLARWPVDAGVHVFDADAKDRVRLAAPSSQSALRHCQAAATTNASVFYSRNGRFVLADPARTARYTFTDSGSGLSYRDLVVANDRDYVFTSAEVRDSTGRTFVAVDADAEAQHGRNGWSGDLETDTPNLAQAFADWQVYRFARPSIRLSQLTCKSFGEAATAMCFWPGERVTVERTDGDFEISPDVYVDEIRISSQASSRRFEVSLSLSPADVDDGFFTLDSSLLDSGDVLSYA